jgi:ATP-dependent DNA helicase PIF1
MSLSQDQAHALALFQQGNNLFLTGPAGTGKSFLIDQFISHATNSRKRIQICATTGVAAILLGKQARTIHSWSGIKLCRDAPDTTAKRITKEKKYLENWQNTDVLVIDEASMMSAHVFDTLNLTGQKTRNSPRPFGGIQLVLVGDLFQLPPVGSSGEDAKPCFQSAHWFDTIPLSHHIELTTPFRQTDPTYVRLLNQVREGSLNPEFADLLRTRVQTPPPDIVLTRLFPRRNQVDYVNKTAFDQLTEPIHEFPVHSTSKLKYFVESGKPITAFHVQNKVRDKDQEIQNLQTHTQLDPVLRLRQGAHVMCTVNLDQETGIVNGSQGRIVGWTETQKVRVLDQYIDMALPRVQFKDTTLTIQPRVWQSANDPKIAIAQLPLTLSWALTIHKSQGATLDAAQMDLGQNVFEYGQAYVALSRVRSIDGLFLTHFEPQRIRAHPDVVAFYQRIRAQPRVAMLEPKVASLEPKVASLEPKVASLEPPTGVGFALPEAYIPPVGTVQTVSEPVVKKVRKRVVDPDIKVVRINREPLTHEALAYEN